MTRITFLALALGAGIAGITVAILVATDHPRKAAVSLVPMRRAAPADLAPLLHRCAAIDHGDPDTGFCMAVWEENRRRFLGKPAQPLRPSPAVSLQPKGSTL